MFLSTSWWTGVHFSLLLPSQRVASRTWTSAVLFEHLDRELKNSRMPCFGSSQGCAWDAVLFPFSFCVSQSPCCLILVDLLHNLHQSWSPCDKPTYVSEMQDLQVDRSLIYAGDKGCWSMIMIICLCQWFQCHSLCKWESTWQSLQTYQAKTTNACVYSYELKGWIFMVFFVAFPHFWRSWSQIEVKIFTLCSLFANIYFPAFEWSKIEIWLSIFDWIWFF